MLASIVTACSSEPTGPYRPQEPVRPYPYEEVQIRYPNPRAGIELAGTFTFPTAGGPFPTVLLILGSGQLTRDCVVADHKIFLVLADHLTRQGFAVLRVDKRGLGESTGDYSLATSVELGDDVLAGVELLTTRPEVDRGRIGLVGLSEGGLLAPAVANASPDVAFVVSLGGPAVGGEQVLAEQAALIARAQGDTDDMIALWADLIRRFNGFVRQGQDRTMLTARLQELGAGQPPWAQQRLGRVDLVEVATSPWYRFYIDYDPAPALAQLRVPILFFIGEKDLQVSSASNLPAADSALRTGGNADVTVTTLPRINHALQTSDTGNPAEYGESAETIAPAVLTLITDWLRPRTR